MSHHGHPPGNDKIAQELCAEMEKLKEKDGTHPEGKLNEQDDGVLAFSVGHDNKGHVFLQFAEPTTWVAFGVEQAIELANSIYQHAHKAL